MDDHHMTDMQHICTPTMPMLCTPMLNPYTLIRTHTSTHTPTSTHIHTPGSSSCPHCCCHCHCQGVREGERERGTAHRVLQGMRCACVARSRRRSSPRRPSLRGTRWAAQPWPRPLLPTSPRPLLPPCPTHCGMTVAMETEDKKRKGCNGLIAVRTV